LLTSVHGAKTQNSDIFIPTAVKISDLREKFVSDGGGPIIVVI
jgi:hypothetical protein